ncbi:MAG: dual specificity protein phosphatase family protein [Candidatus Anammoxibacter sp.]
MNVTAILVSEEILNISALEWALSNLSYSRRIRQVVVAVARSLDKFDPEIQMILKQYNAFWFKGANEIIERLFQVAEHFSLDVIVKVNLSCPYVNVQLIDWLIRQHIEGKLDYTYPNPLTSEQHVEVISVDCLRKVVPILQKFPLNVRRLYQLLPMCGEQIAVLSASPILSDEKLLATLCPDSNRRETIANYYITVLGRRPTPNELTDDYTSNEQLTEIRFRLDSIQKEQTGFQKSSFDWITDQIAMGPAPIPQLWLQLVQEERINAFLNVSNEDFLYKAELPDDIHYYCYTIADGELIPNEILVAAVKTLSNLCKEGYRVYIHCHAGISRSGSILALYLSLRDNITYSQAIKNIQKRRPVCNPNPNLVDVDSIFYLYRSWKISEN